MSRRRRNCCPDCGVPYGLWDHFVEALADWWLKRKRRLRDLLIRWRLRRPDPPYTPNWDNCQYVVMALEREMTGQSGVNPYSVGDKEAEQQGG